MIYFAAIARFLKAVPWQIYLLAAIAAIGVCAYQAGQANIQNKWDDAVAEAAKQVKQKTEQREQVTVRTEVKYVDRVKVVHEKGETIYKLREQFVPTDSGMLDGGFRLFFDAATLNTIPDPAEIPNAASVPVADVAATYAYNAEQCNKAFAKLDGWREWADEQLRLNQEVR